MGVTPSSQNLIREDPAGDLEARLHVQGGDGIEVHGSGTAQDPLVIACSISAPGATYVKSGNSLVEVSGDGRRDSPFTVSHKTGALAGTYAGFTFDDAGHMTNYSAPTANGVQLVKGGDGITVDMDANTGTATVSVSKSPVSTVTGTFTFGGYDCEINDNRIDRMTRKIQLAPIAVSCGSTKLTFNEFGSLAAVDTIEVPTVKDPLPQAFSRIYALAGDPMREFRFTTEYQRAFRISYCMEFLPPDTQLFVDGQEVAKYSPVSGRIEALTPTVYAPGEHAVSVVTAQEGGFTAVGVLDVWLVAIGE